MLYPTDSHPAPDPRDHAARPLTHRRTAEQALDDLYQRIDEDLAEL